MNTFTTCCAAGSSRSIATPACGAATSGKFTGRLLAAVAILLLATGCSGGKTGREGRNEPSGRALREHLGLEPPVRLRRVTTIDDGGSTFIEVEDAKGDSLLLVKPARVFPITPDGNTGGVVVRMDAESLLVPRELTPSMDSILRSWPPLYPYLYMHGRPGKPGVRRIEPGSPAESVAVDLLHGLAVSPGTAPIDSETVASVARDIESWRARLEVLK